MWVCFRRPIILGHFLLYLCPSKYMRNSVAVRMGCVFFLWAFSGVCVRTGHTSTFETTTDRPVTPVGRATHSFPLTESIIVEPSVICESAPSDVTFCSRAPFLVLCVFKPHKSVSSLVRHVGRTVIRGLFVLTRSPFHVTTHSVCYGNFYVSM
jgi:hypothetical protein